MSPTRERFEPPSEPIDLLFVDGDHREEGVRADFEHWSPHVRVGGHVLFHDAVAAADFTTPARRGTRSRRRSR